MQVNYGPIMIVNDAMSDATVHTQRKGVKERTMVGAQPASQHINTTKQDEQ